MNHWERAFAVAVMIFGATVFGYIVGSVAEMAMHTRQDPASQSIFTMRQYCEEHGFHQKVIHSLRRHYDFWFQERSHFEFEPEILQRLPVPLRREVVLHIHRHLLAGKISLFKVSVPSWLQAVLARLLEPQAFLPGELVLPSGETSGGDLIFVYEGLCEAFVDSSGHPLTKPVTRRRRKKKEVRSSFLGGTFEVLEAYGPGSMLGFEQLLGEEALQSFGCPSDCAVRASPAAAPSVYALRVSSLVDAQRAQPVLAGMLTELMTTCIVSEGRRRVKERASEYYQKLEAYRLAKQNFQASPIALRFAAFGNSEAETIRSRLPSRNSRGSPPETPQLSVVAFATPPNERQMPGAAPAPPCEAVPHLVVPPGANASMLQATEAPSEDTVQGCQLAQSRSWEEFPALPDEGQPWSGQPTEQADVPKLLAGGDERTQPWDPGGHEASQGFNTLHQPQLEPEAADAARRASQASEVSLQ
ncbi:unnamed protein product [Effrenium voratum]|nr:unnamed protein product [Effrenium voratum]